jgi:DNA-binding MarR family transcriptional regulator
MSATPAPAVRQLGEALEFLAGIWRLNHALERLSSRMDRSLGVTAQQRFVVRCVGKYPGLTAGALAEILHLHPGTVSAALNRLEERGLLERRQDDVDRRRVVVRLTDAGRAVDRMTKGTVEHAVVELFQVTSRARLDATQRVLAEQRKRRIRALLWDDRQGLFADYDFVHDRTRRYPFATTFFPLWVGAASPEQAGRIVETALPLLERPGGLVTSTNVSGSQWDAPFAWAPLQLAAVRGLRRYGFNREADRIAVGFLRTVLHGYVEQGAIFEKYDVDRVHEAGPTTPRFGYATNEIGFGWTNGVFLELEAGLAADRRPAILGDRQRRKLQRSFDD